MPIYFDATFFSDWTDNENEANTRSGQYRDAGYDQFVTFSEKSVREELQRVLDEHDPDIIFFSAISSHIHGEGEYVALQYGLDLMNGLDHRGLVAAGGLQVTASPELIADNLAGYDLLISGETDLVLADLADALKVGRGAESVPGISYTKEMGLVLPIKKQPIISNLDILGRYDYSIFPEENFFRPYNGSILRAVDFEISRGCIYTCSYCVETVIQRYYGFEDKTNRGALRNWRGYVRCKSPEHAFAEFEYLHKSLNIQLFRMQDTNFLTIDSATLNGLAERFEQSSLDIKLYIETRPEGVNPRTIELLKKLKVDGVGLGIEMATQEFRENELNRYANQEKILTAFSLLKEAGIKRTAYNIIGLPGQDEESIKKTIEFNRMLRPDNITVAYFSPFLGTPAAGRGSELNIFDQYEFNLDAQLRSTSKSSDLDPKILNYYKNNFVSLVRE